MVIQVAELFEIVWRFGFYTFLFTYEEIWGSANLQNVRFFMCRIGVNQPSLLPHTKREIFQGISTPLDVGSIVLRLGHLDHSVSLDCEERTE